MSGGTSSVTIIVGNLGADPELRYMPDGREVLNIGVATSIAWKDKEYGENRSETEWHRCVLFGKRAENAAKYLHKGSKVWIEGRNRTRKWTDKEGHERYTTEIIVNDIQYLDKAPDGKGSGSDVNNAQDAMDQIEQPGMDDGYPDDIPI